MLTYPIHPNKVLSRTVKSLVLVFLISGFGPAKVCGQKTSETVMFAASDSLTVEKTIADTTRRFGFDKIADQANPTEEKNKQEIGKAPDVTELISPNKIFWTLVFLLFFYFLIRLILGLLSSIAKRSPNHEFAIKRLIPILRILFWSVAVYIIIKGIFKPPPETIFAFLASIGVAIGFSAQDLLKNVFGGLVVMFDKPFQVGDKIEAGKYYGEVTHVGIRSTRIVTPDDSTVTIPNSEFMTQYVSNANFGENNCQVVAEIYLPLDVDTEKVREIALDAAQVSKYIYLAKPIVVLFQNETNNRQFYLKMKLKAYVSNLDKEFHFKSEMTEIVVKTLLQKGIIPEEFYRFGK